MSGLPDAATLDTLVLGVDEAEDRAAWRALVELPGGLQAWDVASARRRRLDLLAGAVRGRPWLARSMQRLSALSRRVRARPAIDLLVELPDARLDALAGASLGPVDDGSANLEVRPLWGQIVPIRVQLGDRVGLRAAADPTLVDVRYLSGGRDGALPTHTWRLDPGEAPVLLIALVGAEAGSPLSDALTQATAAAGVLLLEIPRTEETSA